ncbi:MAG: carboxypeptidase-like regulatory domain-containing protein [Bacteroidetes bacterium]|nr:carboxypeptidase-like regulatory domain-containing protein [Bacteroidota bacterium]
MKRKCIIYLYLLLTVLTVNRIYAQTLDSLRLAVDNIDTSTDIAKPVQKYKVRGTIRDKLTGNPVEFATIYLSNTGIGTPADTNGNFDLFFDALPNDTLKAQALGYKTFVKILDSSEHDFQLYIQLEASTNNLKDVVVHAGEDPAIMLVKKIIAAKPRNNPERFDNYGYVAYNKVELDILNLSKKQFEELPVPYLKNLSYIYRNIDSTSEKKPFLPFYLTETISDNYYQDKPRIKREYIRASQIKGINNENINKSITQYVGNMYLPINPYNNYIVFFFKQYISPINNAGPTFYKYKIIDTVKLNGYKLITVSFKALREGENCFEGSFRVVDSVYALQHIEADIPKEANINWLKDAKFYKDYSLVNDSVWFCTKENFTTELLLAGDLLKTIGLKARKTNIYTNVKFNDATVQQVLSSKKYKRDVVIAEDALDATEDFWVSERPELLSKNEQGIYNMFDTLERDPKFRKFRNTMKIVASGVWKVGWFEFGPYWNIYSYNNIEGTALCYSMGTTPKLSKDVYINGYVAYGFRDKEVKYNVNGLWLLKNDFPRTYIAASYTHDIDLSVNYYDRVTFDNALSFAVRKPGIPAKFMFANDARFEFYKEHNSGFSYMLTFLRKTYDPYAPLPDASIFNDENGLPSTNITQTETNIRLRYAYKERFLNGNYFRSSLGSKYPIIELRYSKGIKGALNGGYDYNKLRISISQTNLKIAPFGSLYINLFAGKYFGTLPYPLLEVHPGNETYVYNKYAFSMMNQYEFISDQYVGFNLEHSLGGGFLKYIPGVKKLKLRQFWTAKGVMGSLNDSNTALNMNKGFAFKTLASTPYIEVGTGIENILKVFRVDFIWRVAPQPVATDPRQSYFGIFGSMKLTF